MKESLQSFNDKIVKSSLGWRLDILSAKAIQYTAGDRAVILEVEDCANVTGELEWILYTPDTWVWTIGDRTESVPEEEISEILDRIVLAFWKLDMPIKEIV